ncbi:MAG TPA: hypothetical protein VE869_04840 [Gemmatimonas sp.]|nr:hypothetical protein [Gemmatimonas sp.]
MSSSPLLTDLVRTLNNVPDPAAGRAAGVRQRQVSDNEPKATPPQVYESSEPLEQEVSRARCDAAMQELISALESLHALLRRDAH